MSLWQFGHNVSVKKLFKSCCASCSTLEYAQSFKITTDARKVLIQNYYSARFHEDFFKVSDKPNQFYMCGKCSKVNLLTDYPLAPPDIQNLPVPEVISKLNQDELQMVGLVGLFSTTSRSSDSEKGIFQEKLGQINALHKDDTAYFHMYCMLIEKQGTKRSKSEISIRRALHWLKENNFLYKTFHANYETMLRYMTNAAGETTTAIPVFSDTTFRPVKIGLTTDTILEEEQRGLLIPDCDLKGRNTTKLDQVTTASQHLKDFELARRSQAQFLRVKYGDSHLEAKIWPSLFPYGCGSYSKSDRVTRAAYVKLRLTMMDDRFRKEANYQFYMLDLIVKQRIQAFNSIRVNVKNLKEPLTKSDVYDPFNRFGTEVPATIPNSKNYWSKKTQELLALAAYKKRQPEFFVTLTQNDHWPEIRAAALSGVTADVPWDFVEKESRKIPLGRHHVVDHPVEMVIAFYRRLQEFKKRVFSDRSGGPLGIVEDYFLRIEYQARGGLHAHIVIWVVPGTAPPDAIVSEMPRTDHPHNQKFRDYVSTFQLHTCKPTRCFTGKGGKPTKRCKYGFPFAINETEQRDKIGLRYLYVRRETEDCSVSSYNLGILLLMQSHVNVQRVTSTGWELYMAKYISKAATSIDVDLLKRAKNETTRTKHDDDKGTKTTDDEVSGPKRFLTTRLVSSLECAALLLQKYHVNCSRQIIYLPVEIDPNVRFLKRKRDLLRGKDDSTSVYYDSKLDKYLDRPASLEHLTYPQYFAKYHVGVGGWKGDANDLISDDWDNDDSEKCDSTSGAAENIDLIDCKGRVIRKRIRSEAVTYFKHYALYGHEVEMYCLVKLLSNVPVNRATVASLKDKTGSYLQECLDRDLVDRENEALHFLESAASRGFSTTRLMEIAKRLIEGNWLADQNLEELLQTVAPYHLSLERGIESSLLADDDADLIGLNLKAYLPLDEYLHSFSETQRLAYEYLTSRLDGGKQVLATVVGEGGAGKSFLLDSLVVHCRENNFTLQKLATTGSAAYIIGGLTIHYFFKLDQELECHLEFGTHEAFFIKNVQLLLIDEVSMLEEAVLAQIDRVCREFGESVELPFGGKSVVMFGDPAQLPPVHNHVWTPKSYSKFQTLVLRSNMRVVGGEDTGDDDTVDFVGLLNRVRIDECTKRDYRALNARVMTERQLGLLDYDACSRLVARRTIKNAIDEFALAQLEGEASEYPASDVDASGNPVGKGTADFIARISRQCNLLPKNLRLKIGAKVMLIRNRDVSHGWVNGRLARVFALSRDYVVIQSLTDPALKLFCHRLKQKIIFPNFNSEVYRVQFPIELAYGITIQKIQGQTLERAVVDAGDLQASGQFYTAVSRVKSIASLQFTEFDPASIYIHLGLKQLLVWIDEVDVLRSNRDFVGFDRPSMPHIPPTIPTNVRLRAILPTVDKGKKCVKRRVPYVVLSRLTPKDPTRPFVAKKTPNPIVILERLSDKHIKLLTTPKHSLPTPVKRLKPPTPKSKKSPVPTRFVVPRVPTGAVAPGSTEDQARAIVDRIRQIDPRLDAVEYKLRFAECATLTPELSELQKATRARQSSVFDAATMRRDERVQKQLYAAMADHLVAVVTEGDGHCLFRALSLGIFGTAELHMSLRVILIHTIFQNWEYYGQFGYILNDEDRVQDIIHHSCLLIDPEGTNRGWGTGNHIKAAALATNREVYVYSAVTPVDAHYNDLARDLQATINAGGLNHFRHVPDTLGPNAPLMVVLTDGASKFCAHFSAVLPLNHDGLTFRPGARADILVWDRENVPVDQNVIEIED